MSFPRYPAYKNSGVKWLGEVPEHWEATRTKHVINFTTGWTPPTGDSASFEGANPWANISDLGAKVIHDTTKHISDAAVAASRIQKSPAGSLLFSFKLSIGQVSFAGVDLYTNEAIATFLPSNTFNLSFAFYALPLFLVQNAAENIYGAKLLNQELMRSAYLALAPLNEQIEIATFLNRETAKIDALIAEQQRLIELLQEKRQAVISHAVTKGLNPDAPMKDSGVEWLGEVPEHWTVCSFRRFTRIAEGQVDPRVEPYAEMPLIAPNHIEARTGLLTCLETAQEQGAESGKYLCKSGDVIYSKIRPALRKACIAPQDCLTSADMYPLQTSECLSPDFLLFFLLSEEFSALAVLESERVAMPKVNRDTLGAVPMAFPPRGEQADICRHIAEATNGIDELANEAASSILLLQERRSAFISAAVTGQIDVRGLVPEASAA
jgi:type I restriction enzyme S subunit